MTRRSWKARSGTALLLLVACFVAFPLYWLIVASTKNNTQLFGSGTFVPAGFAGFGRNLHTLFTIQGGIFGRWLLNSAIYAVVCASLATYISTLSGYTIAKFRFLGRSALLSTVIGSLMVPSTVLIVPLFILEHALGFTNTYEGVILPLLVFPFGVYFMSIYAEEAVSSAVLEAARMDGAHEMRIFHRIVLPLLVPGMVTLFLISFIGTWNNYFLPLVLLGDQKLFPITVGLSIWLSTANNPGVSQPLTPEVIIGSFVSVLPMLLAFPFLQKYVARGLSFGAVVGE